MDATAGIHRRARERGGVALLARNRSIGGSLPDEPRRGRRKVERFGWTFAPGDKVMQVENDYDKEVYTTSCKQRRGARLLLAVVFALSFVIFRC